MPVAPPPSGRASKVLALAGALAVVLVQAVAIDRQSLTMDEPYHLLAGEQAWRSGTNALNLEHPPLVKLVATLPLLGEDLPLAAAPVPVEKALEASRAVFRDADTAERWRLRSRWTVGLAFGLPWLLACFALGRRVAGHLAGVVLALGLGLSSAVVPFVSIVQTDAAVALGFALTLLALLAFLDRPDPPRALAAGAALGLALATKFSALLLLVPVATAVALVPPTALSWRRRVAALSCILCGATAVLLGTYALANLRYDEVRGEASLVAYCQSRGTLVVDDRLRGLEDELLALEDASPAIGQWTLGAAGIAAQNAIGIYPSYAFGEIRSEGRWWYFPAVLAVKTPLPLLALLVVGAALGLRWWWTHGRPPISRPAILLTVAAVVYLAAAMTSSYNLGSRHLLPILPLLLLPAARWVAGKPRVAVVALGLLAVESFALAPLWMSATNTWWLGERNPTRLALGAGDTEYKQNFLALASEARERGIDRLGVVFPATSTDEVAAAIPGGWSVGPGEELEPGWYAVTVLLEQAVPAIERARPEDLHGYASYRALAAEYRPLLDRLKEGEDHGIVAGSFRLVRLR